MLKKICMSILSIIFIFLISCEANPLIGVGSTVDTIAPEVSIVTPQDCSYVRDDFNFEITCYDNLLVTKAKLEIEKNGEKIFEKTETVSPDKEAGRQAWSIPISLKNDLKISTNDLETEFKMIVYVYDARGNLSEKSYKSITIVVDIENAETDIYYPVLFKKTKCDELRNAEINSENFTIFQNSTFQINGECNDNSNSIQSACLTLKDENGQIVSYYLEDLLKNKNKCITGSLLYWKLAFSAEESENNPAISLNVSSPSDTYFYEVFLQVKDKAGNITFTTENGYDNVLGKSFGWFAVRQVADYPFSDFSSINNKVSANSILTGKSYDDDGIKRINIYRKTVDIEEWELIKSYSSDGEDADETLNGTPTNFTWTIPSPETSTSTEYQLKVEVVDIYDNSSLEGYEKERISEDKVFCSFGLVDPAAPTVEPIDLTDFKGVVDKNGDFTINVKASDNSAVNKIYLAWKPENLEEKPQWSILDSQENKVYTAENGIKYWNISPETLEKEANQSLTLNVYDDFDNHYDKKSFYIYVEDDSGKHTQTEASMPRFTELPDVKFTSPNSAAVETTYNNQTFNIIFEISSFIKKLKTVEISGFNADEKHSVSLDGITPIYDTESNSWKYECTISSSEWWKSGEGNGSYSLVVEVKDVFDNVNTDMLSFEIDNGVPKIKSVSAETEPGSYCAGSEIEILLEMKKDVFVDATKENLTLILNNGGIAYYNPQKGRTIKPRKQLYFTYKIEETDESVALDAISLELNGAKIYDDVGNIDGLGDVTGTSLTESIKIDSVISIEKNSSSMLIIDNIPPKVTTVTSVTPNGSYTVDDVINLIVEFDEEINVSGNPTLTLSNNQIANFDKLENHKQLYFNYKVENAVNIDKLEWKSLNAGVDGVIKDCAVNNKDASMSGNKVDFSTLVYSSDVSLVKSGQIFRIDNQNPVYKNSTSKYNTDGSLSFTINFDEPVYKVSGKKAVLMREAYAVPVVLSVDKYNEYVALVPEIADYYEEGVNGASSSFKIDNTTKYVLKYEYDETHSELLELFKDETLGFYKQEIMMESNWVESDGNSIVITIPKENLLTGEFYTLTVEDGFAEDQVGLPYEDDFATSGKIQAGTKAQPPVIRIKKITGGNAQITVMKINTITKDASIKYNTNGSSTLDADYATEVELGSANYTNATYKIKAQAQIDSGTASDYGYEVAYKTVIYTSHEVKTSGDEVYFRGSNVESGTATVPNFPFSWDEASSPLLWVDRGTATDVGMIKATLSNKRYYVVSWGVTDTLYFRPLSCKKETETGRLIWAWGQGGSAKVSPGETSDSNIHATAGAYEKNYHDRFGNNY